MLVYTFYSWLRKPRGGRLERERQRACMVLLTIVSLIFLQSGRIEVAVDRWVHLADTVQGRADGATALSAGYAASR